MGINSREEYITLKEVIVNELVKVNNIDISLLK